MKIFKKILCEVRNLLLFFVNYFPGYIGIILRRFYYKFSFQKLGSNFNSEIGFKSECTKNIQIGNNANFTRNCSLNSCEGIILIGDNFSANQNVDINSSKGGTIEIGSDVLIGNNVVIRSANHIYKNTKEKINESGHNSGKISIGNNVWIGANCVILKDVSIGDNSVIGAGTVVSKNVKDNQLAISNKQENIEINK